MGNGGRPSIYSRELIDRICEQLASGMSMRAVCKADDMPAMSTVFKWLREHPEFSEQYAIAKEEAGEAMFEEILEIADDGTNDWLIQNGDEDALERYKFNGEHYQRSRLRVDARKWYLSKLKPKKYGDKLGLTDGDGGPVKIQIVDPTRADSVTE